MHILESEEARPTDKKSYYKYPKIDECYTHENMSSTISWPIHYN